MFDCNLLSEQPLRVPRLPALQFGPKFEARRSTGLLHQVPALDLGVGLAFELDTAELQPQVSRQEARQGMQGRAGQAG